MMMMMIQQQSIKSSILSNITSEVQSNILSPIIYVLKLNAKPRNPFKAYNRLQIQNQIPDPPSHTHHTSDSLRNNAREWFLAQAK